MACFNANFLLRTIQYYHYLIHLHTALVCRGCSDYSCTHNTYLQLALIEVVLLVPLHIALVTFLVISLHIVLIESVDCFFTHSTSTHCSGCSIYT